MIPAPDVGTIYEVPLVYHAEGLDREVLKHFGMPPDPGPDLARWRDMVEALASPRGEVRIAVVGKYTSLPDAYKSLSEALVHGGLVHGVAVRPEWMDSRELEGAGASLLLEGIHGILVPGGFGERGTEGKIEATRLAREGGIPFLGICFGMQMAVIECARNLAGLPGASSTEFGPCKHPVIGLMTEWARGEELEKRAAGGNMGGTMRLGSFPCALSPGSLARETYGGAAYVDERHRHRYEVNLHYRERLESAGLRFSGMSPDGILPEIVEYPGHPWFVGVQFHPELKSKPFDPHPLFSGFVGAAVARSLA